MHSMAFLIPISNSYIGTEDQSVCVFCIGGTICYHMFEVLHSRDYIKLDIVMQLLILRVLLVTYINIFDTKFY